MKQFLFLFSLFILSLSLGLTAEAVCSTTANQAASFIKTYHLRDNTDGFGVLATRDGGYLLTGDTIWAKAMSVPNAFAIKTDATGKLVWSQQFSSQSTGQSQTANTKRISTQTTDGSFVTATDVIDFVDDKYFSQKELWGDIIVSKLDAKGKQLWSLMVGDYSMDFPQKIWSTADGGVVLLVKLMKTGYGQEIADTEAIPQSSVFIKINKNGKVEWSKKMNWTAIDAQYLPDGGFIALANVALTVAEQPEHILGPEIAIGDLPTIIRLDNKLNISWAKSLEMIPSEINSIASISSSSFTMGVTKFRMMGGDFRAVQPTPDNGFLTIGFDNLLLTKGLKGTVGPITQFDPRPLVAVKVDKQGNYQWTKKLTGNLSSGITANDIKVTPTVDGDFVIMQDVIRDSAGQKAKYEDAGNKAKLLRDKCDEFNCKLPGDETKIPAVKPYYEASNKAGKVLAEAWAGNIELIKIDPDFNPRWIKKIDVERTLTGYDLKPTSDKGVIVSGKIETTKMYFYINNWYPYNEAILIKVDANGGIASCASISDQSKAIVQDQSSYLVMQDMKVGSEDLKLKINKTVKPKITNIKNTVRDICQYKNNNIKSVCSYINSPSIAAPLINQTGVIPAVKTWAQINFDNAQEGKIETDKSQQINDELLPILKQVFGQVKMVDNMSGLWLTYKFPRLVTRADVEVIEKKYMELGYKIEESVGGILNVSKIGRSLRFNFSVTNPMEGKLELNL
ncbi:MAG: hypothetical protein PHR00_03265 [Patescibacteria group bacterium]|nr:hypothetical protein [Patescibacteria group bacterium]